MAQGDGPRLETAAETILRKTEMSIVCPAVSQSDSHPADRKRFLLWIDGVGSYLLCLSRRTTIGGPGRSGERADLALLANLSSRQATIVRGREGYWLEAHGLVCIGGRSIEEQAYLTSGSEIELGNSVKLRFRLPTALSGTAVLDFESDHRPARSLDGVVLMEKSCLLGPGSDNHIRCRDWAESVVLYRKEGRFWCKSRADVWVGQALARGGVPLEPGEIVSGPGDVRFWLEAIA